jgi:pyruvate dehydrogenase E2 component (dihydrolipoamide acetyltransferase)
MAIEVRMAKLSPTMDAGTINRWVKKEGDTVASGDTLAEVETDKASMPLETFEDGVLLKILVPEGKQAAIDQLVAVIGAKGEDISAILAGGGAPAAKKAAPAAPAASGAAPAKAAASATPAASAAVSAPALPPGTRLRVSPLAKKIAAERGVNLAGISATGPGGRIIARDVQNAPANGAGGAGMSGGGGGSLAQPVLPGAMQPGDEDLPLSGVRQTIAKRLLQSKQTIPHFYLYNEVLVDRLVQWREECIAQLKEGQPKISINDLVIKIAAVALQRHPEVNAAFNQTSIRRFGSINIAVAVATEDGLYTPVLRNVDKLNLGAISTQVKELAGKAREKKLRIEELTGSGFTISNLGMFGIDHFFAIINPPEAAILAVGGIKAKPVVTAKGELGIGKMMGVSLSCDHRVIDGAVGARFMQTLCDLLEHPAKLLL